MKHIIELLKKFQNLTPPHNHTKKALIKVLNDLFHITIEKKDIAVKKNTLFIQTSPHIKNAIALEKARILEALQKETQTKQAYDIR